MEILYKCEYCGSTYHTEKSAHKCEVAHEEWLNSEIEAVNDEFSCIEDGTPYKIRLRNKNGVTYVYGRMSRENR